nr:reverse transcriptase domain-containing protein [Tanacetum cinerariifolium]
TPSEPIDSLSMRDEHLDTILATESDEFIKSCVETLVPDPSESEGENGCNVPSCFTTFSNILFDDEYEFESVDDQSLHNEDFSEKIFSNPLFEEEIISIKKNQHHFNAESDLVESMLNRDSLIISSSSKIDSLLDDFAGELTILKSIPPGIDKTDFHPENEIRLSQRLFDDQSLFDEDVSEKIYSNPLFDMEIASHSFNAKSDLIESLPNHDSSVIISSKIDSLFDEFAGELTLLKSFPPEIDKTDCHPEKEIHLVKRLLYDNSSPRQPEEIDSDSHMEEIDLFLNPDDLMSPSIEEDDDDSERDIPILEELLDNYSLSLPTNESYHFDIPLPYRPPAKPPDDNTETLNIKMMGDVSNQKGFEAFQPSAECLMILNGMNTPVSDVPLFHFYPLDQLKYGGIRLVITLVPKQEKSLDLLSHLGLETFQPSAECPMMIHGKNTPILDETNNFDNSLPEFTTFSKVLFDAKYKFDSSYNQSSSDEDVLEKIVSKPLSEEEIIPMESLRTHDSSLLISSKIDSLLEEFVGELTLLKSIPPGIDETDCDFEEDIHLIEKLLYDNSSPRLLKEFVSANSDAEIKSFSPSPIFVKDIDSLMEEIDLFCTPDYPIPPALWTKIMTLKGILSFEKSPDLLSHRCGTFKKFNTHRSHLNESPIEIDPESLIRRRNLGEPSSLFDFEKVMSIPHNNQAPPPVGPPHLNNNGPPSVARPNGLALRSMEELCQPESVFEAWERYKLSIDRCPIYNMLLVTQIDTFYNGLTLRHKDTINVVAGGTFMQKKPKEYPKCETCGGPHSYTECPAIDGYTQEAAYATTGNHNSEANPKGDLKAITTQNRVAYDGPTIPPTPSPLSKKVECETEATKDKMHHTSSESTTHVQPLVVQVTILDPKVALKLNPKPSIPYPSRLNDQNLHEKDNNQMLKFLQIFQRLHFDISFADALLHMPKFASTFKYLLKECLALADLGASINLMPLSVWKKLSLPKHTPTRMSLELANQSVAYLVGVAEDVLVKVGKFYFLADLVVVDYDVDPHVPLILGRSFLRMTRELIDVHDVSCVEYAQEVIGFLDSLTSGNPTPSDPIIASFSPSFTPFEGSDFILEETETFLHTLDELTNLDDDYYDTEGDIFYLEKLVNEDPSSNLPPMKNEDLKQVDVTMTKPSIEEPLKLELKDLPSHLEYAFLEGTDKLPVIISKELKDKEKATLLKVIVRGHKNSKYGIEVDRVKVDVIAKLPHPTFVKGAVLGQRKTKHFQPIHYASKTMMDAQAHYTMTEKELLAVVYAFKKLPPYLVLSKTIVYTDHSALKYLLAKQDAKPRLLWWILLLQEFDVIIRDKKGA